MSIIGSIIFSVAMGYLAYAVMDFFVQDQEEPEDERLGV